MTYGLFSESKSGGGGTTVMCTRTPFPCYIQLNNTGIYWQELARVHISPILAANKIQNRLQITPELAGKHLIIRTDC